MDWLHPDGEFNDAERARKRGITIGKQQYDGMSPINGYLTPEARATMEAVLAKRAAPGACNPEDDAPVIDATPDEEAVRRDGRSQAQRNHDGLLAWLRALLASGELGQHNGLPVSIVVTTTLKDLEAAAGKAHTGGGSLVPMSDVIRMASHANHYLATFDNGRPLALYHTKRFASPAQRIMLYAKDRGCTKPGCDAPAYHSQVHHVRGCRPPGAPISTTSHWPAGPITGSQNRAGPPAPTPAAKPNGSRHPTSTTDNHEPTPTTTPNDSDTTTKIRSPQDCQTDLRWKLRRSGMLKT